jgi:hypothetical protein
LKKRATWFKHTPADIQTLLLLLQWRRIHEEPNVTAPATQAEDGGYCPRSGRAWGDCHGTLHNARWS